MSRLYSLFAAALVVFAATSSHAQSTSSVTARNPAGVVAALKRSGHEATLSTDDFGDPMITTTFNGYEGSVMFYGCDEETHTGCTSLQFVFGFDSEDPFPLEEANELARKNRYISVSLDEEGDPYVLWDIVTLGGIPYDVFTECVSVYSDQLDVVADAVFGE
jgi:hypothetical protein